MLSEINDFIPSWSSASIVAQKEEEEEEQEENMREAEQEEMTADRQIEEKNGQLLKILMRIDCFLLQKTKTNRITKTM